MNSRQYLDSLQAAMDIVFEGMNKLVDDETEEGTRVFFKLSSALAYLLNQKCELYDSLTQKA